MSRMSPSVMFKLCSTAFCSLEPALFEGSALRLVGSAHSDDLCAEILSAALEWESLFLSEQL
jgi:hypothetical protein